MCGMCVCVVGDGEGVDCCGEAQRSGAKRPAGALGTRRMPQVDRAASRHRASESAAHEVVRRGVVTPLMYACQQSRETQVRELLAQKARLLLLLLYTATPAFNQPIQTQNAPTLQITPDSLLNYCVP
jgi:hypothetical protein